MAKKAVARTAEEVLEWVKTEGYRLEHTTAAALRKAGCIPQLGQTYRDRETEKLRDIDVAALVALERAPALMWIVAECKGASTGAFVVRRTDLGAAHNCRPISSETVLARLSTKKWVVPRHLPLGDPAGFTVFEAAPQNSAYDTVNQAVSSAIGWLDRQKHPSLVFPTVILGGAMPVVLDFDSSGQASAESVDSVRVSWGYEGADDRVLVHIVHESGLGDWAREMRHRVGELADEIMMEGLMPALPMSISVSDQPGYGPGGAGQRI